MAVKTIAKLQTLSAKSEALPIQQTLSVESSPNTQTLSGESKIAQTLSAQSGVGR